MVRCGCNWALAVGRRERHVFVEASHGPRLTSTKDVPGMSSAEQNSQRRTTFQRQVGSLATTRGLGAWDVGTRR